MASTILQPFCAPCSKSIGQLKCEDCSQAFCKEHLAEHRQSFKYQLDKVMQEHEIIRQTIKESKDQTQILIASINQWEDRSIEKIREKTEELRKQINEMATKRRSKLVFILIYFCLKEKS